MNREFTYSTGTKIAAYIFGVLFITGGCYFFYEAASDDKNEWFYSIIGLVMILMAVYVPLNSLRKKITITDELITLQGTFKTKSLVFKNAKGFRTEKDVIMIDPIDKSFPMIYISDSSYISDNYTMKSMIRRKLINLDNKIYQESLDELLNDKEIGLNRAERRNKLIQTEKFASYLNKGGIVISLWLLIYPHPYDVVLSITIVYPFLIVYFFSKHKAIVTLSDENGSAYPSLNSALLLPTGVLVIKALSQYDMVKFTDCLVPCCVIFLIALAPFLLLIGWHDLSGKNKMSWLYAIIFALLFSYGATICINCNYDYSVSKKYKVKVLDQYSSSGKQTTYHLTVSAWGTGNKPEDLSVYHGLYSKVKKGDRVTVYVKKGLLHIPWFFVDE
jgi:hypothetical protein